MGKKERGRSVILGPALGVGLVCPAFCPNALNLCWFLFLNDVLSFSDLMEPIFIFPANEGTVFLPPSFVISFGTLLSLPLFRPRIPSAVLFLLPPTAPGHPSHPSLVSLRSPSQVG